MGGTRGGERDKKNMAKENWKILGSLKDRILPASQPILLRSSLEIHLTPVK